MSPKYKYASGFYKEKALVKQNYNESWKLIDKNENILVDFKNIREFVYMDDKTDQKNSVIKRLIDEDLAIVRLIDDSYSNLYIINSKGKLVSVSNYRKLGQYNNGFAYAEVVNGNKDTSGFINKKGQFVLIVSESQF